MLLSGMSPPTLGRPQGPPLHCLKKTFSGQSRYLKILVTGGTGFIGSHLIERLHGAGHMVVVPVRKGSNLKFIHCSAETRPADMEKAGDVESVIEGIDVIFHLAGVRGSGWQFTDEEVRRINVGITKNLLNASYKRVKHFIYLSSVSVYGRFKGGPADEDYPCQPETRYGRSKSEAEKIVDEFHRGKRLPTTIIRPVITYGPGDTWGMVPKLIRLINSRKYLAVGGGKNRVHLIYIDDLIDGLLMVMLNPQAIGKTYVIAGEEPIAINRLVEIISGLLNKKAPPVRVPVWFANLTGLFLEKLYTAMSKKAEPFITRDKVDIMTRDRFFSSNRIKNELGYASRVNYEDGVKRTIDWLRAQRLL